MISLILNQNFLFFLFADDNTLLYADKNSKSLETTVNSELLEVSDWLNANKLSLYNKETTELILSFGHT